MKKALLILLITISIFSCSKQNTEIEFFNNKSDTISKDYMDNAEILNNRKPKISINKDDTLKIYVRSDGAPGMYLDSDGTLKGYYVELEKAIMEQMEQKYELIPYSDLSIVYPRLKSGTAHSAIATPILKDYKVLLNISAPHEILNYVLFMPKDENTTNYKSDTKSIIQLMSGKKVGVQTKGHTYMMLREYRDIELVDFPTSTVALKALANNEVDYTPDIKRIGEYYSNTEGWQIKSFGDPIYSTYLGTGFSKALDSKIIIRYNNALNHLIKSGFIDDLHKKYFGVGTGL